MKILVVDDDPITSMMVGGILEDLGHVVTLKTSGADAWQILQSESFNVVISDWVMPVMDGVELCQQIRRRSDQQYTYFILLTVMGLPEDRSKALEAGADDFLIKPIAPPEIVDRLDVAQRILKVKEEVQNKFQKDQNEVLGDVLVAQGVISPEQLRTLRGDRGVLNASIEALLLERKWVTDEQITRGRSVVFDVPYVDILNEQLDPFTLSLISYDIADRYTLMPLSYQESPDGVKRIRVAMADPYDIEAIDQVQRETRRRVEPIIATRSALKTALRRAYSNVQDILHDAVMSDAIQAAEVEQVAQDDDFTTLDPMMLMKQSDQAPVIRFVNTLFADAVFRRASDIHIEPGNHHFQIHYRIDGHMRSIRSITRAFLGPVTSRIKIMAELDIAERRLPQDGHISLRVSEKSVDMRVSTLPTQFGERLVIRILDRNHGTLQLSQLGLSSQNYRALVHLTQKPHGIILVTGPTGSGKTTTLYAALSEMIPNASDTRSRKRNIITCEDPIEYRVPGISQSNVNERAGLTFARQLRAILRQDPDVILIGEIRDSETADIAFRAALTGHLVLTTLHCNEAAGAVSRLYDLGVAPFFVASALIAVVSQRLVPRLCVECRRPYVPSADRLALFREPPRRLYEPFGCPECTGLGFKGRIAIHEVMVVTEDLETQILGHADTPTLRRMAVKEGMRTILDDGLDKVAEGIVNLDDVLQKTGKYTT